MTEIGIGIVGGGYMGKLHAAAFQAVGTIFETPLRPRLAVVAASSETSAERYRSAYGFDRATADWRSLVDNPAVGAVIIASPQDTHAEIALAAIARGKHVLCEKPLATTLAECETMVRAAHDAGIVNMTGFNYIKTPATQLAQTIIREGAIGRLTWFRGEHTEDFLADPEAPLNWRTESRSTGAMGDLSPHMIQCALTLAGPIEELVANIVTVIPGRPDGHGSRGSVTNDDAAHMLCRFENGASGEIMVSRTATGRKMGYAYEVTGTEGAIRFDQEDQNALWLYSTRDEPAERGFRKILTGPEHPDYLAFCQGPGHGTGYYDQIIIEAAHFLRAIEQGTPAWPDFAVGRDVQRVVDAAFRSHETRAWQTVEPDAHP